MTQGLGDGKIVVVGSLNIDTFLFVPSLPNPGETVLAEGLTLRAGGKGFNQSVAAAKCGGNITFFGAIGDQEYLFEAILLANNSSGTYLIRKTGPTGQAFIEVDAQGENRIVVVSGANALLAPDDLVSLHDFASEPNVLLLAQNEVPERTLEEAFRIARSHNWITVLNAAPARECSDLLLSLTRILICNRSEAEYILGLKIVDPLAIHNEVKKFLQSGPETLIVTLGGLGAVLYTNEQVIARESFPIDVIDTTGAGDAFCGGFVAELSRSNKLEESLNFGLAAGALATTRIGASDASASHQEITNLLQSSGRL
jgi:ribokinase